MATSSAAQSSRNLRGFIRWMRDNDVEYSDGLAFHIGDTAADIGVKALYDLHEGEMIATIPKQACLTIVTSEAESLISEAELGGGLGLAVALMYERSIGEQSKWSGYLRLLPFQQCLPFVWSLAEIDRLLTGTELHKVMKEDRRLMKSDWKECYGILLDLFGESKFPAKWFSLDHYLAAKTLVASRAFEVDDIHGFGMVPLADLFNHKTGAEDVHFTSVLSDSDSDAEAEPEPTTPGSGDDTLVETPKAATKRRSKLNASVDDSPKLKEATKKLDESIPNGDESPKPKESIKKRGKFPPAAAESPKPKGLVKKRGELPPTAAESPKPKDSIMKRGKLPPTVAESPKPKGSIKKRGKLPPAAAESPKPKESIKKRAKSAPTVVESPKPEEATKERGKPAPTAADSPKPNEATYKRRGKSVPVEQEEVPTKEGGDSDPIVKEEHAEEDNVEEDANWEGSSDVLEMIMVKDVAKGSEIYNTYGSLSNAGLLHRYGFTEPDNPFDIINVDLALVIDVCGRISSTRHVRRCLALWRKAGCAPCSSQGAEYFEFSVDGKPQAELLVLLYLIHAPEATQDKVEKQARDWNADEVELSDDEEIERVSSAAVYKLAKVLGWTSKLQKKSNSRKRSRDGLASSLLEGTTPNGNNKRMTPQRSSVAPREEDPNPSWLTDFDKWLLTKLVSTSLLAVVTERDSIYPEVSTMSSEKLAGGPPRSTLEEDVAFLKTVDSKIDPKLYHALSLRISERTILKKCATLMKIKSKKR